MRAAGDQISLDDIKAAVSAAIADSVVRVPAGQKWTVREMAREVGPLLSDPVCDGVFREGLVRLVRRVMRDRNRAANRAKQKPGPLARKIKARATKTKT